MFESGDIVLKYSPKYKGLFKYLIQRAICFFTTEWWEGEKTSNTTHAEMITKDLGDGRFEVFTVEPPGARLKTRSLNNRKVVRLAVKPIYFDQQFNLFVFKKMGQKYDYLQFLMFILDWLFRTTWFTKHIHLPNRNVCSAGVAEFYERKIGIPCSFYSYESTDPDDIYDATKIAPFVTIYDAKEGGQHV